MLQVFVDVNTSIKTNFHGFFLPPHLMHILHGYHPSNADLNISRIDSQLIFIHPGSDFLF